MDEDQEAGPKSVSPGGEEILIRTNGIYQHHETGRNVIVLGIAAGKGLSAGSNFVVYTDRWFVCDGCVVKQSDGTLWGRDRDDFHKKFSFVRSAPLYKPFADPEPLTELTNVFIKCLKILEKRKDSYANNGLTINDYMPFGHLSYAQMVQLKSKRIESLAAFLAFNEGSDDPKRVADLKDSLLDLINYAAFYAAWLGAR